MSIQMLQPAFATFPAHRSAARVEPDARVRSASVAILRTTAAIDAVAADWRALEAKTPEATAFQSFDWCRAWVSAVEDESRWRILTVRDDNRLVCVLPMEIDRFLGARVLRWLGEPWTQYGDALVADDGRRIEHLATAWREISSWRDVDLVKLGRVRGDAALHALPGFNGRTIVAREEAPFIDLGCAPREDDKRLRARRKRLESIGAVAFDIVRDGEEKRACANAAIALKRKWLETRGLASSGLFHRRLDALMSALSDSEPLVIGRLRVGGEIAALELGLQVDGRFRSLLGCHDERFAKGSPGHLLIGHMIAWCRDAHFTAYDFMVPADPYKLQWATNTVRVDDHIVVTRARGTLAALWFRLRPRAKQAYARLPDRLRRVISALRHGG